MATWIMGPHWIMGLTRPMARPGLHQESTPVASRQWKTAFVNHKSITN